MRRGFVIAAAAVLAACSPAKTAAPPAPTASYDVEQDLREVMEHVVQPAAFQVWGAAGYISTLKGTRSLTPTTEQGWMTAENGAAALIEAGNDLMLPGRAKDQGDWMKYAHLLTEAGKASKAAIEAKDETAIFETGGRIDEVCDMCHQKYNPEITQAAKTAS